MREPSYRLGSLKAHSIVYNIKNSLIMHYAKNIREAVCGKCYCDAKCRLYCMLWMH